MEKFLERELFKYSEDSKSLRTWVHILVQPFGLMFRTRCMWFSISFCLSSSLLSLIRSVRCTNTVSAPAEHARAMWCLWGLSRRVKMKEFSLSLLGGFAKNQTLFVPWNKLPADLRFITTVFFQEQTQNFSRAYG